MYSLAPKVGAVQTDMVNYLYCFILLCVMMCGTRAVNTTNISK
jgi:hypothetical protein